MSDPFELLRAGADENVATPDVDAIRSRARRIVRRRQFTLGAAATVIAAIAMIGIVVVPSQEPAQLAQRQEQAETTAGTAGTTAEDSAAVESRSGASAEQLEKAPSLAEPGAARARGDGASAPVAGASEGSSAQLDATLTVKEGTVTQRGAEFTLKVCNPSSGSVTRNFSSGQRYDFEVRRSDDLVWRWSDGKAFSQAFGTEIWKAKECKTWNERWNGMTSSGAPASAGRYEAVGVLMASEPQKTKPKSFCLDLC